MQYDAIYEHVGNRCNVDIILLMHFVFDGTLPF